MSYQLGIDLGTTRTVAAVHRHGQVGAVELGSSAPSLPSLALIGTDGTVLVGDGARRRAVSEPDRVVADILAGLGRSGPPVIDGRAWPSEALVARLLTEVRDRVMVAEGGRPGRVVLTHPTHWGPERTDQLRGAAVAAGFDRSTVDLLAATEAAALASIRRTPLEEGRRVAICDLGGGSSQIALFRRAGAGVEPVGPTIGDEGVSGGRLDDVMVGLVLEAADPPIDPIPDHPGSLVARRQLRRACREARERLSSDDTVTIEVVVPGRPDRSVRVTRAQFEARAQPLLVPVVRALRRVFGGAEGIPGDIARMVLLGGVSHTPVAAELVSAEAGRPVAVDRDAECLVAMGAALAAARSPGMPVAAGGPAIGRPAARLAGPATVPVPSATGHPDPVPDAAAVAPSGLVSHFEDTAPVPTFGGGVPTRITGTDSNGPSGSVPPRATGHRATVVARPGGSTGSNGSAAEGRDQATEVANGGPSAAASPTVEPSGGSPSTADPTQGSPRSGSPRNGNGAAAGQPTVSPPDGSGGTGVNGSSHGAATRTAPSEQRPPPTVIAPNDGAARTTMAPDDAMSPTAPVPVVRPRRDSEATSPTAAVPPLPPSGYALDSPHRTAPGQRARARSVAGPVPHGAPTTVAPHDAHPVGPQVAPLAERSHRLGAPTTNDREWSLPPVGVLVGVGGLILLLVVAGLSLIPSGREEPIGTNNEVGTTIDEDLVRNDEEDPATSASTTSPSSSSSSTTEDEPSTVGRSPTTAAPAPGSPEPDPEPSETSVAEQETTTTAAEQTTTSTAQTTTTSRSTTTRNPTTASTRPPTTGQPPTSPITGTSVPSTTENPTRPGDGAVP